MTQPVTNIEAHIYSNALHNEQVLAYARLWAEKNNCRFSVKYYPSGVKKYGPATVKFVLDGKVIIVDNSDSTLLTADTTNVDVYFKRSFREDMARGAEIPVFPLGFNYAVTYKPFSLKRISSPMHDKVYIFRSFPLLNKLSNYCFDNIRYDKMFAAPKDNGGKILMITRLWDPANVNAKEKKEAREYMNALRMDTVRRIRQSFGERVISGIEDGELARNICPGLVIPRRVSGKNNYLNLVRSSDICIATSGLENTLGWRIGEYIAFAKAVVTEKFDIVIPGLQQDVHYSVFSNTDIKDKIEELLYHKKYTEMQQANHVYYQEYLSPLAYFSRIVWLSTCLEG